MINPRNLACGVLCAAFGLGTFSMSAQQPGLPGGAMQAPSSSSQPDGNVESQVSTMTQQYGLSQEQTTQLRAILQEEQQKASSILKDTSLTPPDVFAKMKSLKEERITRISAIMTSEQRTKYESDIKKTSAAPSQPSGFPPPPPGFPGGAPPTS